MNIRNFEKNINDHKGYHPLFIFMLILLFHILLFFKFKESILNQITLRDFDGYWHLARTRDLYFFGNTYTTTLLRSNAPYGERIHWTSAFDLLLYAGARFLSFFVDFNLALLWWSIILNPFLHALTFLILFWGLRDLMGNLRASIFGILFTFQLYIFGLFDMGVPDHHGAQIFLFSMFLALIVKSVLNDNRKLFAISGTIGGISLWFGIENISIVLIVISFLGIMWILEGNTYQSKNILFSFALLTTISITIFFDTKPDEIMMAVYDRASIVHVFLFLIITSFWAIVTFFSKWNNFLKNKNIRIIAATTGAIACILLMRILFANFFLNPISDVNPVIKLIYLNQTSEFTGLFSEGHSNIEYVYFLFRLPAVPIGIYLALKKHSKEKIVWIFITMINIFYIVFSALMSRIIPYSIICSLIPISYTISQFYLFITEKISPVYYRIARTTFIFACGFSFIVPTIIFSNKQPDILLYNKDFLSQVCRYLNDEKFFEQKPKRILTSIYLGPLIFYKTQHEVIGTPSHRNVSGILDTYHIMNAQKENDAHAIIHRRGIQFILIGRPKDGIGDYFIDNIKTSDEIFHHQLWKGNIPYWLKVYPVPKSLEGKIKIFRVIEKS